MNPIISVILPTWNNPQYLTPCVRSIMDTGLLNGLGEIIIVNNGKQPIREEFGHIKGITVLDPGENLGWEKGLELGVKHSKAPFLCFQNDDTHIPISNANFYMQLLYPFSNANVAAVGPITTVAAGWHSIYQRFPLKTPTEVSYLIFFTAMIRRAHYDLVGGIDTSCPGGDDLDLSMRLRKAGKNLVLTPRAFLIHHGFKTGERVKGGPDSDGGWNSLQMRDRTNHYLIAKHGFKFYWETVRGLQYGTPEPSIDLEGNVVRSMATEGDILELGCGYRKTIESSLGMDIMPKGETIPHVPGGYSVADVVGDVSKPLPFNDFSKDTLIARHILEHCVDTVSTLKNWNRVLRMGGRMIIAVPNQDLGNMIPLNPEHVHAFTPESLKSLMDLCGFKQIDCIDPKNGVSFVGCYKKILHIAGVEKEMEMAHG